MIKSHRLLLAACLATLLPFSAFSEAPVVDDSENFAMLDEQQAPIEQPVARGQIDSDSNDEEPALANDTLEAGNPGESASLLDKLRGLQQDVQELRGQLEVQAHDLKLLQEQQLAFYKDLDARLRQDPVKTAKTAVEITPPPAHVAAAPVTTPPTAELSIDSSKSGPASAAVVLPAAKAKNTAGNANPADEQLSYLAAYELVKNKQFDDALVAMQAFAVRYPQGGYTANAQYWLGELYMVKKNYPQAIQHFDIVLQQFPSSSKSAASLLKIGYALAASGKKDEARAKLQQIVKNYPDTTTAQLATTKLESLKS